MGKRIFELDILKYLGFRLCGNSKGDGIYPYKNSIFQIHKNATLQIGGKLLFNCEKIKGSKQEGLLRMDDNTSLIVDGEFKIFYGSDIALFKNATLKLGSGFINAGCQIRCGDSITIGDNVAIGRNFFVQDSDFHTLFDSEGIEYPNSSPVVIGDNVWIGANVIVLKGVHIGKGAVIGAGTIVTKDVPENAVVVGNPNRVIRENVTWK